MAIQQSFYVRKQSLSSTILLLVSGYGNGAQQARSGEGFVDSARKGGIDHENFFEESTGGGKHINITKQLYARTYCNKLINCNNNYS